MAATQLSNGNSAGTVLGQSASDTVGFFGATPVVQRTLTCAGATCVVATAIAKINAITKALRDLGLTS